MQFQYAQGQAHTMLDISARLKLVCALYVILLNLFCGLLEWSTGDLFNVANMT